LDPRLVLSKCLPNSRDVPKLFNFFLGYYPWQLATLQQAMRNKASSGTRLSRDEWEQGKQNVRVGTLSMLASDALLTRRKEESQHLQQAFETEVEALQQQYKRKLDQSEEHQALKDAQHNYNELKKRLTAELNVQETKAQTEMRMQEQQLLEQHDRENQHLLVGSGSVDNMITCKDCRKPFAPTEQLPAVPVWKQIAAVRCSSSPELAGGAQGAQLAAPPKMSVYSYLEADSKSSGRKASKFWEASVSGSSLEVRWGKTPGTSGSGKTKSFPHASREAAQAAAGEQTEKKRNKGYESCPHPSGLTVSNPGSKLRCAAEQCPNAGRACGCKLVACQFCEGKYCLDCHDEEDCQFDECKFRCGWCHDGESINSKCCKKKLDENEDGDADALECDYCGAVMCNDCCRNVEGSFFCLQCHKKEGALEMAREDY
jgi:predicted DNA-binding WGR domain protein